VKGAQLLDQSLPPSPYPSPRGRGKQSVVLNGKRDLQHL
jgi:hypothetical protein